MSSLQIISCHATGFSLNLFAVCCSPMTQAYPEEKLFQLCLKHFCILEQLLLNDQAFAMTPPSSISPQAIGWLHVVKLNGMCLGVIGHVQTEPFLKQMTVNAVIQHVIHSLKYLQGSLNVSSLIFAVYLPTGKLVLEGIYSSIHALARDLKLGIRVAAHIRGHPVKYLMKPATKQNKKISQE